jgi:hypothetical protein
MSYKTVGAQPQDKKGSKTVASSWDTGQSTSTKHPQPRGSARKGK